MRGKTIKTVALIPHLDKKEVVPKTQELIGWLVNHGVRIKLLQEDALNLGQEKFGFAEEEVMREVELIVVLGGDGTLLRAVQLLQGKEIPILGVNFGKFGFLCEVEASHLFNFLDKVFNNDFEMERRSLLDCKIFQKGKLLMEKLALNDVVISREAPNKLLVLDVYINEKFFYQYPGDGIILASPTGASAYSFSAGGPWVSPQNEVIVMTPLCPHTLFNRSLVLFGKDKISLKCSPKNSKKPKVAVSIDGALFKKINFFELLKVSLSPKRVNLIRFGQRDFYTLLKKKFEQGGLL